MLPFVPYCLLAVSGVVVVNWKSFSFALSDIFSRSSISIIKVGQRHGGGWGGPSCQGTSSNLSGFHAFLYWTPHLIYRRKVGPFHDSFFLIFVLSLRLIVRINKIAGYRIRTGNLQVRKTTVIMRISKILALQWLWLRVVASDTRGPRFEYSHRRIFI